MSVPPLIISLGDPCGTGAELIAEAHRRLRHRPELAFAVIGDAQTLKNVGADVAVIHSVEQAGQYFSEQLPVLNHPLSHPAITGQPDQVHAPFITGWIRTGVELCLSGQARGLVTAPIAKSVLYGAGFRFPGHTEYLGDLTQSVAYDGTRGPVMMLTAKDLRVVLATIHIPLAEVKAHLSPEIIHSLAHITHEALKRDFGIANPRLVIAGLNPHAGEDGTIGREEIDLLTPVISQLQNESIDIKGPFPADTLFHEDARKTYDAALCLYHDQGLIPLKTLDFWGGVNITLGLPIVRTSPDHGTGFAIAGKGIARPD
ncbi:MAG: 4-hydroxythreonine-4-phosphate dehydrogenase PdxA, partial [Asticcacaulis sp.]